MSQSAVKLAVLLIITTGAWTKSVTVSNGTVHGGKWEDHDANYFLAIPYAKPPVGDLRFAATEQYNERYNGGVLLATSPAPRCIQFGNIFVESGTASEDCLYIDIWAPASADENSKLPVKVWLYGGSNQAGSISNALYDGCPSAKDSIIVSINYRLGPLGFLAYPDAGIEGNFAIGDQLLALSWIQEEVASFGGDPDKVLLFGQSAGAMDAFALASLPQAPSLFRAVAMQSGGVRDSPDVEWTRPYYTEYIRSLGCSPESGNTADCLRKVSVTDMNHTLLTQDCGPSGMISASTLISDHEEGNAWTGVVDGKLISENPSDTITEADYNQFLTVSLGPLAGTVKKLYPWSAFEAYSPLQGLAAMRTIYTEVSYKCPAQRGLKTAAAKGIEAWVYSFNHTNSCPWLTGMPDIPKELIVFGPTHTGEIPYLFGQTKNLPRPDGSCNFTAEEDAISEFMMSAWTSMAENGRPANDSVWPAWTPEASSGITINDAVSTWFLNMTECEFWDKIIDEFAKIDASASTTHTSATIAQESPTSTSTVSGANILGTSRGRIACLCILLATFINLGF